MRKEVMLCETLLTSVVPERVFKMADECLVEIRLVESRQASAGWTHEFEVRGEVGKVEKFFKRVRRFELGV
jgi:hypothetical protein